MEAHTVTIIKESLYTGSESLIFVAALMKDFKGMHLIKVSECRYRCWESISRHIIILILKTAKLHWLNPFAKESSDNFFSVSIPSPMMPHSKDPSTQLPYFSRVTYESEHKSVILHIDGRLQLSNN